MRDWQALPSRLWLAHRAVGACRTDISSGGSNRQILNVSFMGQVGVVTTIGGGE
ncbi:MAG: hypothetical protein AAF402_17125 [Pseudomonadota bacterium]